MLDLRSRLFEAGATHVGETARPPAPVSPPRPSIFDGRLHADVAYADDAKLLRFSAFDQSSPRLQSLSRPSRFFTSFLPSATDRLLSNGTRHLGSFFWRRKRRSWRTMFFSLMEIKTKTNEKLVYEAQRTSPCASLQGAATWRI